MVETIFIDGSKIGEMHEGIGCLSAGVSSRLLQDYPEPQRTQILDLLFKPKFGASLQHLKIELGSDANSTNGSEPAVARTREECDVLLSGINSSQAKEQMDRSYEVWLVREAKKRNPDIKIDVLEWGSPLWVGYDIPYQTDTEGRQYNKFFCQDNADYRV